MQNNYGALKEELLFRSYELVFRLQITMSFARITNSYKRIRPY